MFNNFRNLDVNACIEGEDWISAGRLFHKIIARGKNEHNDDDLFTRGTGQMTWLPLTDTGCLFEIDVST